MPSIKEYNNKLKSLKNTQKITKTMKMVSASKLRKAHESQTNAKIYAQSLTALASRIANSAESTDHVFFNKKEETQKALILVITSDKGLCGAFNNNAHKQVTHWIGEHRSEYQNIDLACCGKKGYAFFKSRENVISHYENITINPTFEHAKTIGENLSENFINDTYDEIFLVYNEFFSPLSQKSTFKKILPIDPKELIQEAIEASPEYIFEPKVNELLEFLIPHYLYFTIYFALLENSAGEHGARMSAMDSASKNASDLMAKNTLLRNRARQAQITTELTEIVSGAEALK